jgi:hypothetical protein
MEDPLGLALLNGQQLIDDLAIIDDLYDIYGQEVDCFGKLKEQKVYMLSFMAHFFCHIQMGNRWHWWPGM